MMIDRIDASAYEYATQEDRSGPRTAVIVSAKLRPSGGRSLSTVVRDISLSGFSAVAISRLSRGTHCWLTLPNYMVLKASVVWWEQGRVGCAFEKLLDQSALDAIVAESQ